MPTDIISTSVTNDGAQLFSVTTTVVGNSRHLFNEPAGVPDGTVSLVFTAPFTQAALLAVEITCDQIANVYTNAADGTGGNHFALVAGSVITWFAGSPTASPFTHDVTSFYINNASGHVANLKISILYETA